jgi:hypothetical protein
MIARAREEHATGNTRSMDEIVRNDCFLAVLLKLKPSHAQESIIRDAILPLAMAK